MQVLIEPIEGGGFRARVGSPFDATAEGTTDTEAVERVVALIRGRLPKGTRVMEVSMPGERSAAQKLADAAGDLENDPLFEAWLESIEVYRSERDAEIADASLRAA